VRLDHLSKAQVAYRIAHYQYSGGGNYIADSLRILLDTAAFSNPTFLLQVFAVTDGGSDATAYLLDCGTSDSSTAGCSNVVGSDLDGSDTAAAGELRRSGAFTPVSGHQFVYSVESSSGQHRTFDAHLMVNVEK
jgi:hypothetical protein